VTAMTSLGFAILVLLAGWGIHAGWLHQRLRHARIDPVTGLAVRSVWTIQARRTLAAGPATATVLLLDLDRFKAVNDSHGHDAGDQVLAASGRRLLAALPGGVVCRLGGDEFAAVTRTRLSPDQLDQLAVALAQPITHQRQALRVSASIGVTYQTRRDRASLGELLHGADRAMYRAKQANQRGAAGMRRWRVDLPAPIDPAPPRRVRRHGPATS
jgi:diguanylate cyclase (GGDEF)-like protein